MKIVVMFALGCLVALLVGSESVSQAKPKAQAEEKGLAAKYPGDKGIARDPAVLFAEDFETGSLEEIIQRWTEASNQDNSILALANDAPPGSSGKRALQMTATLGKNTGGHLYKQLPRGVDKVYARFYVKFAPENYYTHHFVHLGGYNPATRYPQGGAGDRPRGDERITVGIEPTGDYGRFPPPGRWFFYTYWQDMKVSADNRYWGNGISPEIPAQAPKGKWQCVEVMLSLNSAPDKADGELALWLDGKPVMRVHKGTPRGLWSGMGFQVRKDGEPFEGFRWRNTNDLKINFFWLLHYVTENAARQNSVKNPNPNNRVWFDNIVVSTRYVGPIQAPLQRSSNMADSVRFFFDPKTNSANPEHRMAYGLSIAPPWSDGGALFVNFPEHLEYMPGTRGIARHHDKRENVWQVSADGSEAKYAVESLTEPGVFFEVKGRAEGERAAFEMSITNRTKKNLNSIRPLICCQYHGLTGFPRADSDNFAHTFVVMNGKLTPLIDLSVKTATAYARMAQVKGCPDEHNWWAEEMGGFIEKPLDMAFTALTAEKDDRKVLVFWTPGKNLLSNKAIPCIHADPYFGDLAPGETRTAKCLIVFTRTPLEPLVTECAAKAERPWEKP